MRGETVFSGPQKPVPARRLVHAVASLCAGVLLLSASALSADSLLPPSGGFLYSQHLKSAASESEFAAGSFSVRAGEQPFYESGWEKISGYARARVDSIPLGRWALDQALQEDTDIPARLRAGFDSAVFDIANIAADEALLAATAPARQSGIIRNIGFDIYSPLGGRRAGAGLYALGALHSTYQNALAWQLRGNRTSGSNAGNVGLIYRTAINEGRGLGGVNFFLDYESEDLGGFWRWSLGAEARSPWVDVFANYYDNVTDSVVENGYATYTAGGYDLEIQLHSPDQPWLIAALGYYEWPGEFGGKDEEGLRTGVKLRPYFAPLEWEVEFEDNDGGESVAGRLLFNYKFGDPYALRQRAPSRFRPQDWFFAPAEREYTQRIRRQRIERAGGVWHVARSNATEAFFHSGGTSSRVLPGGGVPFAGAVTVNHPALTLHYTYRGAGEAELSGEAALDGSSSRLTLLRGMVRAQALTVLSAGGFEVAAGGAVVTIGSSSPVLEVFYEPGRRPLLMLVSGTLSGAGVPEPAGFDMLYPIQGSFYDSAGEAIPGAGIYAPRNLIFPIPLATLQATLGASAVSLSLISADEGLSFDSRTGAVSLAAGPLPERMLTLVASASDGEEGAAATVPDLRITLRVASCTGEDVAGASSFGRMCQIRAHFEDAAGRLASGVNVSRNPAEPMPAATLRVGGGAGPVAAAVASVSNPGLSFAPRPPVAGGDAGAVSLVAGTGPAAIYTIVVRVSDGSAGRAADTPDVSVTLSVSVNDRTYPPIQLFFTDGAGASPDAPIVVTSFGAVAQTISQIDGGGGGGDGFAYALVSGQLQFDAPTRSIIVPAGLGTGPAAVAIEARDISPGNFAVATATLHVFVATVVGIDSIEFFDMQGVILPQFGESANSSEVTLSDRLNPFATFTATAASVRLAPSSEEDFALQGDGFSGTLLAKAHAGSQHGRTLAAVLEYANFFGTTQITWNVRTDIPALGAVLLQENGDPVFGNDAAAPLSVVIRGEFTPVVGIEVQGGITAEGDYRVALESGGGPVFVQDSTLFLRADRVREGDIVSPVLRYYDNRGPNSAGVLRVTVHIQVVWGALSVVLLRDDEILTNNGPTRPLIVRPPSSQGSAVLIATAAAAGGSGFGYAVRRIDLPFPSDGDDVLQFDDDDGEIRYVSARSLPDETVVSLAFEAEDGVGNAVTGVFYAQTRVDPPFPRFFSPAGVGGAASNPLTLGHSPESPQPVSLRAGGGTPVALLRGEGGRRDFGGLFQYVFARVGGSPELSIEGGHVVVNGGRPGSVFSINVRADIVRVEDGVVVDRGTTARLYVTLSALPPIQAGFFDVFADEPIANGARLAHSGEISYVAHITASGGGATEEYAYTVLAGELSVDPQGVVRLPQVRSPGQEMSLLAQVSDRRLPASLATPALVSLQVFATAAPPPLSLVFFEPSSDSAATVRIASSPEEPLIVSLASRGRQRVAWAAPAGAAAEQEGALFHVDLYDSAGGAFYIPPDSVMPTPPVAAGVLRPSRAGIFVNPNRARHGVTLSPVVRLSDEGRSGFGRRVHFATLHVRPFIPDQALYTMVLFRTRTPEAERITEGRSAGDPLHIYAPITDDAVSVTIPREGLTLTVGRRLTVVNGRPTVIFRRTEVIPSRITVTVFVDGEVERVDLITNPYAIFSTLRQDFARIGVEYEGVSLPPEAFTGWRLQNTAHFNGQPRALDVGKSALVRLTQDDDGTPMLNISPLGIDNADNTLTIQRGDLLTAVVFAYYSPDSPFQIDPRPVSDSQRFILMTAYMRYFSDAPGGGSGAPGMADGYYLPTPYEAARNEANRITVGFDQDVPVRGRSLADITPPALAGRRVTAAIVPVPGRFLAVPTRAVSASLGADAVYARRDSMQEDGDIVAYAVEFQDTALPPGTRALHTAVVFGAIKVLPPPPRQDAFDLFLHLPQGLGGGVPLQATTSQDFDVLMALPPVHYPVPGVGDPLLLGELTATGPASASLSYFAVPPAENALRRLPGSSALQISLSGSEVYALPGQYQLGQTLVYAISVNNPAAGPDSPFAAVSANYAVVANVIVVENPPLALFDAAGETVAFPSVEEPFEFNVSAAGSTVLLISVIDGGAGFEYSGSAFNTRVLRDGNGTPTMTMTVFAVVDGPEGYDLALRYNQAPDEGPARVDFSYSGTLTVADSGRFSRGAEVLHLYNRIPIGPSFLTETGRGGAGTAGAPVLFLETEAAVTAFSQSGFFGGSEHLGDIVVVSRSGSGAARPPEDFAYDIISADGIEAGGDASDNFFLSGEFGNQLHIQGPYVTLNAGAVDISAHAVIGVRREGESEFLPENYITVHAGASAVPASQINVQRIDAYMLAPDGEIIGSTRDADGALFEATVAANLAVTLSGTQRHALPPYNLTEGDNVRIVMFGGTQVSQFAHAPGRVSEIYRVVSNTIITLPRGGEGDGVTDEDNPLPTFARPYSAAGIPLYDGGDGYFPSPGSYYDSAWDSFIVNSLSVAAAVFPNFFVVPRNHALEGRFESDNAPGGISSSPDAPYVAYPGEAIVLAAINVPFEYYGLNAPEGSFLSEDPGDVDAVIPDDLAADEIFPHVGRFLTLHMPLERGRTFDLTVLARDSIKRGRMAPDAEFSLHVTVGRSFDSLGFVLHDNGGNPFLDPETGLSSDRPIELDALGAFARIVGTGGSGLGYDISPAEGYLESGSPIFLDPGAGVLALRSPSIPRNGRVISFRGVLRDADMRNDGEALPFTVFVRYDLASSDLPEYSPIVASVVSFADGSPLGGESPADALFPDPESESEDGIGLFGRIEAHGGTRGARYYFLTRESQPFPGFGERFEPRGDLIPGGSGNDLDGFFVDPLSGEIFYDRKNARDVEQVITVAVADEGAFVAANPNLFRSMLEGLFAGSDNVPERFTIPQDDGTTATIFASSLNLLPRDLPAGYATMIFTIIQTVSGVKATNDLGQVIEDQELELTLTVSAPQLAFGLADAAAAAEGDFSFLTYNPRLTLHLRLPQPATFSIFIPGIDAAATREFPLEVDASSSPPAAPGEVVPARLPVATLHSDPGNEAVRYSMVEGNMEVAENGVISIPSAPGENAPLIYQGVFQGQLLRFAGESPPPEFTSLLTLYVAPFYRTSLQITLGGGGGGGFGSESLPRVFYMPAATIALDGPVRFAQLGLLGGDFSRRLGKITSHYGPSPLSVVNASLFAELVSMGVDSLDTLLMSGALTLDGEDRITVETGDFGYTYLAAPNLVNGEAVGGFTAYLEASDGAIHSPDYEQALYGRFVRLERPLVQVFDSDGNPLQSGDTVSFSLREAGERPVAIITVTPLHQNARYDLRCPAIRSAELATLSLVESRSVITVTVGNTMITVTTDIFGRASNDDGRCHPAFGGHVEIRNELPRPGLFQFALDAVPGASPGSRLPVEISIFSEVPQALQTNLATLTLPGGETTVVQPQLRLYAEPFTLVLNAGSDFSYDLFAAGLLEDDARFTGANAAPGAGFSSTFPWRGAYSADEGSARFLRLNVRGAARLVTVSKAGGDLLLVHDEDGNAYLEMPPRREIGDILSAILNVTDLGADAPQEDRITIYARTDYTIKPLEASFVGSDGEPLPAGVVEAPYDPVGGPLVAARIEARYGLLEDENGNQPDMPGSFPFYRYDFAGDGAVHVSGEGNVILMPGRLTGDPAQIAVRATVVAGVSRSISALRPQNVTVLLGGYSSVISTVNGVERTVEEFVPTSTISFTDISGLGEEICNSQNADQLGCIRTGDPMYQIQSINNVPVNNTVDLNSACNPVLVDPHGVTLVDPHGVTVSQPEVQVREFTNPRGLRVTTTVTVAIPLCLGDVEGVAISPASFPDPESPGGFKIVTVQSRVIVSEIVPRTNGSVVVNNAHSPSEMVVRFTDLVHRRFLLAIAPQSSGILESSRTITASILPVPRVNALAQFIPHESALGGTGTQQDPFRFRGFANIPTPVGRIFGMRPDSDLQRVSGALRADDQGGVFAEVGNSGRLSGVFQISHPRDARAPALVSVFADISPTSLNAPDIRFLDPATGQILESSSESPHTVYVTSFVDQATLASVRVSGGSGGSLSVIVESLSPGLQLVNGYLVGDPGDDVFGLRFSAVLRVFDPADYSLPPMRSELHATFYPESYRNGISLSALSLDLPGGASGVYTLIAAHGASLHASIVAPPHVLTIQSERAEYPALRSSDGTFVIAFPEPPAAGGEFSVRLRYGRAYQDFRVFVQRAVPPLGLRVESAYPGVGTFDQPFQLPPDASSGLDNAVVTVLAAGGTPSLGLPDRYSLSIFSSVGIVERRVRDSVRELLLSNPANVAGSKFGVTVVLNEDGSDPRNADTAPVSLAFWAESGHPVSVVPARTVISMTYEDFRLVGEVGVTLFTIRASRPGTNRPPDSMTVHSCTSDINRVCGFMAVATDGSAGYLQFAPRAGRGGGAVLAPPPIVKATVVDGRSVLVTLERITVDLRIAAFYGAHAGFSDVRFDIRVMPTQPADPVPGATIRFPNHISFDADPLRHQSGTGAADSPIVVLTGEDDGRAVADLIVGGFYASGLASKLTFEVSAPPGTSGVPLGQVTNGRFVAPTALDQAPDQFANVVRVEETVPAAPNLPRRSAMIMLNFAKASPPPSFELGDLPDGVRVETETDLSSGRIRIAVGYDSPVRFIAPPPRNGQILGRFVADVPVSFDGGEMFNGRVPFDDFPLRTQADLGFHVPEFVNALVWNVPGSEMFPDVAGAGVYLAGDFYDLSRAPAVLSASFTVALQGGSAYPVEVHMLRDGIPSGYFPSADVRMRLPTEAGSLPSSPISLAWPVLPAPVVTLDLFGGTGEYEFDIPDTSPFLLDADGRLVPFVLAGLTDDLEEGSMVEITIYAADVGSGSESTRNALLTVYFQIGDRPAEPASTMQISPAEATITMDLPDFLSSEVSLLTISASGGDPSSVTFVSDLPGAGAEIAPQYFYRFLGCEIESDAAAAEHACRRGSEIFYIEDRPDGRPDVAILRKAIAGDSGNLTHATIRFSVSARDFVGGEATATFTLVVTPNLFPPVQISPAEATITMDLPDFLFSEVSLLTISASGGDPSTPQYFYRFLGCEIESDADAAEHACLRRSEIFHIDRPDGRPDVAILRKVVAGDSGNLTHATIRFSVSARDRRFAGDEATATFILVVTPATFSNAGAIFNSAGDSQTSAAHDGGEGSAAMPLAVSVLESEDSVAENRLLQGQERNSGDDPASFLPAGRAAEGCDASCIPL